MCVINLLICRMPPNHNLDIFKINTFIKQHMSKVLNFGMKKWTSIFLAKKLFYLINLNTFSWCPLWFLLLCENTNMLFINSKLNTPKYSLNKTFIRFINATGALVSLKPLLNIHSDQNDYKKLFFFVNVLKFNLIVPGSQLNIWKRLNPTQLVNQI